MHDRHRSGLRARRGLKNLVAALVLAGPAAACAQAPPALSPDLIRRPQLDQQQIDQVCAYVRFHAERLNTSSTPGEIERARVDLIRPFTQPGAAQMMTPDFRGTYSDCATPEMEKAVAGDNLHRAVNGLIVLSQLGDNGAANAVLRHIDPQTQPRWQVRLHAANAMRVLLQTGMLDPRKVIESARRVRDAALREENGLILRHLFGALNAADAATLQAAERRTTREMLAEALASLAGRLANAKEYNAAQAEAAAAAVVMLRDKYALLAGDEQNALGRRLGPALGQLLTYAQANWEATRTNPNDGRLMNTLVGACEGFLQFIDAKMAAGRPAPSGSLREAWNSGNRSDFDAGVKAWQEALGRSPYKP